MVTDIFKTEKVTASFMQSVRHRGDKHMLYMAVNCRNGVIFIGFVENKILISAAPRVSVSYNSVFARP